MTIDLDVNAKPEKAQAIAHGILTRSGFRVVRSEIVERASAELSRVEAATDRSAEAQEELFR